MPSPLSQGLIIIFLLRWAWTSIFMALASPDENKQVFFFFLMLLPHRVDLIFIVVQVSFFIRTDLFTTGEI